MLRPYREARKYPKGEILEDNTSSFHHQNIPPGVNYGIVHLKFHSLFAIFSLVISILAFGPALLFPFIKNFLVVTTAVLIPDTNLGTPMPTSTIQYFFDTIPASINLKWYPCNSTLQCARLSVPLNPLEPNNGLRSEIPIIKLPADPSDMYKGIILTNPGGPGISGVNYILRFGSTIANFTGPGWDIIGFDTRGTGYSVPNGAVGHFLTGPPPEQATATCILPAPLEQRMRIRASHHKLDIPRRPDIWLPTIYRSSQLLNKLIQAKVNSDDQAVPYMTTPNVAFDMLQIAKADARLKGQSERDVLVNYYGVSYGGLLGQTFASLYPQHVGRFVLDSVVDLEAWYDGSYFLKALKHTDDIYNTFFTTCFDAGLEKCSFFTGHTPSAIRNRFRSLVAQFNAPRALLEGWSNATVVTLGQEVLKTASFYISYNPFRYFRPLADTLTTIEGWVESNNLTQENLKRAHSQWDLLKDLPKPSRLEYLLEHYCSDQRNDKLVGINKPLDGIFVERIYEQSVVAAEFFIQLAAFCTHLNLRPKWRFNATAGSRTKTPMLYIGMTKDPVTPIENAERARELYDDSHIIYVEGAGHGIIDQRNWCGYDRLRDYFQNLTLPGYNNRFPPTADLPFF